MDLVVKNPSTSCEELTHWKRLWCWEGLGVGGKGDDRDGWMASPSQWMWVWVNSGRWWWTGRPGVLWFMGLQSQTRWSNWTDWLTDQSRRRKRSGSDPWVGRIPWRRAWQPTPVFLPGESNGQRSLEGYSPWGLKGLDTTEETNVPMHTHDLFFSLSVPHSLGQEASKNLGRCS